MAKRTWLGTRAAILAAGLLAAVLGCGGSGSSDQPLAGTALVFTEPAFPNLVFTSPVGLLQAPGSPDRWYVVEQLGRVLSFPNDPAAVAAAEFVDVRDRVRSGGEMGLLGMAFHPDHANNRFVFLSYTGPTPQTAPPVSHVSRFTLSPGGQTLDPMSETVILTVPQDFSNHNGGQIGFGPDGYLYIGFGDGGSGNDPLGRAQDTTNLLGAMLRIDVDGGTPYAIPAGNPFAGNARCEQGFSPVPEACPELFAWGLRNPWRWSFERGTGTLWAGDVGQGSWEEIDVLELGRNYGWRDREGAHCNPGLYPADDCPTLGYVDPVVEYDHGVGNSVTGGYVYRGTAIPGLVGVYVYGDFGTGKIFQYFDRGGGEVVSGELLDTEFLISSFGEAVDGELYLLDYPSGTVHRIVAAP